MLHVFIPLKKSVRFPGKNARLAAYTRAWLAQELLYIPVPAAVWTVGDASERGDFPFLWQHIPVSTGSQQGDLAAACQHVESLTPQGNAYVLLQLTQPLRKRGLLRQVLAALAEQEPVITASRRPAADWRRLATAGSHAPHPQDDIALHLDGQVYAWRTTAGLQAIYDPSAEKAIVDSGQSWGVCDIDYEADLPPALTSMAAHLLLN
jgi:hypothetical protein